MIRPDSEAPSWERPKSLLRYFQNVPRQELRNRFWRAKRRSRSSSSSELALRIVVSLVVRRSIFWEYLGYSRGGSTLMAGGARKSPWEADDVSDVPALFPAGSEVVFEVRSKFSSSI